MSGVLYDPEGLARDLNAIEALPDGLRRPARVGVLGALLGAWCVGTDPPLTHDEIIRVLAVARDAVARAEEIRP